MKLATALPVIGALSILAMPGWSEASPHCTEEDRAYARRLGYNAKDAYEFGRVIRRHIENRDLAGLLGLVDGELAHGPRQRFAASMKFRELFTERWRSAVLASEPPCRPVGYRGFMLGNGRIWFASDRLDSDIWAVIAINGAAEEPYPLTGAGMAWRSAGKIVAPECFQREWLSSDNFQAFEEAFAIADTDDFRRNVGRYFGREVDRLDPIDAPWGSETVRLVTFPPACNADRLGVSQVTRSSPTLHGDVVSSRHCYDAGRCLRSTYRLLAPIPRPACSKLAPHLPGWCETAYLVQVVDETGGSMGWHVTFSAYGLFALNDGRHAMVPLVNFDNENHARNFVDELGAR